MVHFYHQEVISGELFLTIHWLKANAHFYHKVVQINCKKDFTFMLTILGIADLRRNFQNKLVCVVRR